MEAREELRRQIDKIPDKESCFTGVKSHDLKNPYQRRWSTEEMIAFAEAYHKAKLEEDMPSDEEVLNVFPRHPDDEEAMRMNSLIRIGVKWLKQKLLK
jgi:hypothetical protein